MLPLRLGQYFSPDNRAELCAVSTWNNIPNRTTIILMGWMNYDKCYLPGSNDRIYCRILESPTRAMCQGYLACR